MGLGIVTTNFTQMHSYKAFGLSIISEIELPELSISEPSDDFDLVIKIGQIALPKLKKTSIYRRGIRANFGEDDTCNLYLNWDRVANFSAIKGNVLLVAPLTKDENLLSLFTVSEALGLILFQRGYFLLHASSVQVRDEAWCFMGNPGAGKSTTAAAFVKAGCRLLSDDLTAIGFDENGEAQIIPAYPQLKIWDNTVNGLNFNRSELQPVSEGVNKFSFNSKADFLHEPVALKEVFFLHKALNRGPLQLLAATKVPTETIRNFPLPTQLLAGNTLKNHFIQSFQCAKSARMWSKRRPNGFTALETWVQESLAINVTAEGNE